MLYKAYDETRYDFIKSRTMELLRQSNVECNCIPIEKNLHTTQCASQIAFVKALDQAEDEADYREKNIR